MYTPPSFEARTEALRPLWSRYAFAVASSALAWIGALWLSELVGFSFPPLAVGFAAVVATAVVGGFGPTVVATLLTTGWGVFLLVADTSLTRAGIYTRLGIFLSETAFVCFCSLVVRRAQKKMARAADWHKRLVETAAEGIWVVDPEGKLTYANPRLAEILGCTADKLRTSHRDDFYFPADVSVERIRSQNRLAGQKEQFDRRLRRPDGSEAWVLACSSPIFDEKKQFLGELSMMTDITERKRAEYALRRSEEKYRNLFENVLEGVYQSTPDGRILAANPMLVQMLGMSSQREFNDINITRDLYVDPGVRSRLLERLEQDGQVQNVQYELRRLDGQLLTVQENARVVRDEEGNILYYEGTLSDITERKRIEEQLRQAQQMEALGRLAGGVAQDFSNVLTVISGYGRLLLDELPASHPGRASAEHVVSAAVNATGLTSQLLSFSRRRPAPVTQIDFNSAVRAAAEAIPSVLGNGCRVVFALAKESLSVAAEKGQIEQILVTVAQNFRHLLPARRTLELHTESLHLEAGRDIRHPEARPGHYAVLSISCGENGALHDTGIAALALNSVVAQLGGFVAIADSPGRGPVVSVHLPVCASTRSELDTSTFIARDSAADRDRILLVNGEPLLRELSRDLLEREGYAVVLAGDPTEAERISSDGERFDLLITDLTLDAGSSDLVRTLRSKQPDLKVLFISGYADPAVDSLPPGSDDSLLRKPFSADSLGRKIRQILNRP